jgi:VanZ family protein
VILVLSIVPSQSIPNVGFEMLIGLDKWAHVGVYIILVILLGKGLSREIDLKIVHLIGIASISILYSFIMEVVQHLFLSDRFFEIPDLIANIIGSILGAVLLYLILKKKKL